MSKENAAFVTGVSLPIDGGMTIANSIASVGPR